jgi:tetratricopeptide (TPR) repeat protein
LAELEFSFGHTRAAEHAVEKSLQLAPRNAEAASMHGFVLAARNRFAEAIASFDRAIAIDGSLGNARLGRGLCSIRQGRLEAGRQDLLLAAALEPQRAVLRSYLGKALSESGDVPRAMKELALAKTLDPKDPTAWLYSALLNQQASRLNEAVTDLEKSMDLTQYRGLFRSSLLLDQDRAVRSANLAGIYRDTGLFEVSVREASRAVDSDYANHSAHLFLANSFNTLRDPNLVNLRYETPTFSEYLVANLLAPVGESYLSPHVSQQEYSRLFDRDHVGVRSTTEYASDGSWSEAATHYGRLGNSSYALDVDYRFLNGHRPNNELQQFIGSGQFQQQLTPEDVVYFQAIYNDVKSGDVKQYYDESNSSPTLRVKERQEPNLFVGFHHAWGPGSHTVFLGSRLDDTLLVSEPHDLRSFNVYVPILVRTNGAVADTAIPRSLFDLDYRSEFDAYSAELQQIWQLPGYATIAGARFQTGQAETRASLDTNSATAPFAQPLQQSHDTDLRRLSVYGYQHWQVVEPLWLIAGLSFDRLDYPLNIGLPPLDDRQKIRQQLSPKAGLLWSPTADTTVRGAYTRSLGGVFFDNSVRLEPTQVAGFIQAYRSLIPESVAGSVPGSRFQTFQLGLDQKFPTRTYLVLQAELLQSEGDQTVGVFNYDFPARSIAPSSIRETLDFEEKSFAVTLNQLVGEDWSLGARYRISNAELETEFPELPSTTTPPPQPHADEQATLHELNLFAIYQHPAGFFGRLESIWRAQSNRGYAKAMPGDDFWQFNVFGGYRLFERRVEITLGLLNLTDQNYKLNPLNLANDLAHRRTFVASLKFSF